MVKVEVSTAWISKKMSECEVPTRFLEQKYRAGPNSLIYHSLKLTAKAPAGKKTSPRMCLTQPTNLRLFQGGNIDPNWSHWPKLPSFASLGIFTSIPKKKQPRGGDLSSLKKMCKKKYEKTALKIQFSEEKNILWSYYVKCHILQLQAHQSAPPPTKKNTCWFQSLGVLLDKETKKKQTNLKDQKQNHSNRRGTTLSVGVHPSLLGLLQHTACKARKKMPNVWENL